MQLEDSSRNSLWNVLTSLFPSGIRYRVLSKEQSWFPDELFTKLLESDAERAVLRQQCELRTAWDEQRCTTVWQIWYLSEEEIPEEEKVYTPCPCCGARYSSQKKRTAYSQSPYVIEDLLDVDRVEHWLEQQSPEKVVAVCRREGEDEKNTFVEQYYRECARPVQASRLAKLQRPIWLLYLDGLMIGSRLNGQAEEISICAETLFLWIACVRSVHERAGKDDLNAEEATA